jgi:hypothetical protein
LCPPTENIRNLLSPEVRELSGCLAGSPKFRTKKRRSLKDYGDKFSLGELDLADQLLLPGALFMAIGLQALFALVLVHLETALFLEVAHGDK